MTKRDPQLINKRSLPRGTMVLMRDRKPIQMTFEAFADVVGKPGTAHIEERIYRPLVRIDHELAMVRARFESFVDGKVDQLWNGSVYPGLEPSDGYIKRNQQKGRERKHTTFCFGLSKQRFHEPAYCPGS
jgi:hypothetical protein